MALRVERRAQGQEVHGGQPHGHGKAVQVDPIKPTLKPPETILLKLYYGTLLSIFAFKFNLRRYDMEKRYDIQMEKAQEKHITKVGRCRLTLSNPC